jgi:hypothetical protein
MEEKYLEAPVSCQRTHEYLRMMETYSFPTMIFEDDA